VVSVALVASACAWGAGVGLVSFAVFGFIVFGYSAGGEDGESLLFVGAEALTPNGATCSCVSRRRQWDVG